MAVPELPPDIKVDEVQLFMLFCLFGGDVKRVSVVTRVEEDTIERLAHDFHWKEKAAGRARLDTEEGKEAERCLNRVATYVTAERMARVFTNLIADLDSDPSFARAFCTSIDDEGEKSFNTKNLVELAKGYQIVSDIKYRALGDKLAAEADTTDKMKSAGSHALEVYRLLQNRFPLVVDPALEAVKAVSDVKPEVVNAQQERTG